MEKSEFRNIKNILWKYLDSGIELVNLYRASPKLYGETYWNNNVWIYFLSKDFNYKYNPKIDISPRDKYIELYLEKINPPFNFPTYEQINSINTDELEMIAGELDITSNDIPTSITGENYYHWLYDFIREKLEMIYDRGGISINDIQDYINRIES